MPSIIGHTVAGLAGATSINVYQKKDRLKMIYLSVICSVLPDADALGFQLGIPYDSFLGHRGFFHSLPFAAILSFIVIVLFFRKNTISAKKTFNLWAYFFLLTSLHPILDGMTTGGRGVALFSPFDTTRYFLPFRPIVVSPIGIHHFFSAWGLRVLKSEFVWIWIPAFVIIFTNIVIKFLINFFKKKKHPGVPD